VLQAKVAANAPYVRRAAVIGISGLQRLITKVCRLFPGGVCRCLKAAGKPWPGSFRIDLSPEILLLRYSK